MAPAAEPQDDAHLTLQDWASSQRSMCKSAGKSLCSAGEERAGSHLQYSHQAAWLCLQAALKGSNPLKGQSRKHVHSGCHLTAQAAATEAPSSDALSQRQPLRWPGIADRVTGACSISCICATETVHCFKPARPTPVLCVCRPDRQHPHGLPEQHQQGRGG